MKRAIIVILVILILGSLGLIGYFIITQNQSNLGGLSSLLPKKTASTSLPAIPVNPFPVASQITEEIASTSSSSSPINTPNTSTTSTALSGRAIVGGLDITGLSVSLINKKMVTLFVDRETGNIYSLDEQNNIKRQSFTTIPLIGEAYLASSGSIINIILRQIKNISVVNQTGQLKMGTNTEPGELTYREWKVSPSSLAISPNGQKIGYLVDDLGQGILYISDWTFQKPKKVWSSVLSSWNIAWPNNNLISITTRPSYNYSGVNYLLDLQTGKTKKTLSNINGLTVSVSPSGERIIYSKSLLSSVSLYSYDVKTGESRLLDFNTLPDKCTWFDSDVIYCAVPKAIPAGNYPDDWYQGKVSFTDNIWRINLKQKTSNVINQPKGNYDLVNLTINKETGWIYAINKGDNKLQAFSLKP